jgi:hypothetical protein
VPVIGTGEPLYYKFGDGFFAEGRSEARLDASPRTGGVNEELSRKHVYRWLVRVWIILNRYRESMAADR